MSRGVDKLSKSGSGSLGPVDGTITDDSGNGGGTTMGPVVPGGFSKAGGN